MRFLRKVYEQKSRYSFRTIFGNFITVRLSDGMYIVEDEDGDYEEYIWLPVGTCSKIIGTHLRSVKSKTGIKKS